MQTYAAIMQKYQVICKQYALNMQVNAQNVHKYAII